MTISTNLNFPAFIFARGGSKGVPNKNLKDFGGKPLIVWAIEQALSAVEISNVFVSTDSIEIANVAKDAGAEVPFIRAPHLATDDSPEWLSWRNAIVETGLEGKNLPFISVPPTSPLRSGEDISMCIQDFLDFRADVVIAVTQSSRSPYFNMVKMREDRSCELLVDSEIKLNRRQDLPQSFDITTVCYVARPSFVMSNNHLFEGHVRGVLIPRDRSVDIDSQEDFDLALYVARGKGIIP